MIINPLFVTPPVHRAPPAALAKSVVLPPGGFVPLSALSTYGPLPETPAQGRQGGGSLSRNNNGFLASDEMRAIFFMKFRSRIFMTHVGKPGASPISPTLARKNLRWDLGKGTPQPFQILSPAILCGGTSINPPSHCMRFHTTILFREPVNQRFVFQPQLPWRRRRP